MTFRNVKAYAKDYKYWVFRTVIGDYKTKWFWGAYNNRNEANEAAYELGGEMWVYGENITDDSDIEWT